MGPRVRSASELDARCIAAPDQSLIDLDNLRARWDTHLVSHLTSYHDAAGVLTYLLSYRTSCSVDGRSGRNLA